jgi:hypothetical protein
MVRERIDSLESDKRLARETIERLQALIDCLGPENARLTESLENEKSYNVATTLLITVGGGLMSYATPRGRCRPSPRERRGGRVAGRDRAHDL